MAAEEQKTVIKGTAWGLVGAIALKLVSFIYLIVTTRLFIQEDIGTFYLALSIINIISIFGDFGLTLAFGRFVPYYLGKGEKDKAFALLKGSYVLVTLFSVLLTLGLILASGPIADSYHNQSLRTVLIALAVGIVFNSLMGLNGYALIGLKKVKEYNILANAQNIVKLAATAVFFVVVGSLAVSIAFGFTLATIVVALASFWYVKKAMDEMGFHAKSTVKEQVDVLRDTIPFGLMLAAITGMWMLISSIDRLMLGYMLPIETAAKDIAVYSVAVSFAAVIGIFSAAITTIFLPTISELYGKGKKDEMIKLSDFATRWSVLLLVPASVLIITFPEQLLGLFYGAQYATGATVLVIFTLGTFARGMSYIHGSVLAALRVVKIELMVSALSVGLNIILNLLLIPKYGMAGSALASAISLAFVSLMLFYYSKKLVGGTFLMGALKPLVAGVIACAIFLLLKDYLAGGFAIPLPKLADGMLEQIYQKSTKLALLGMYFLLACAVYLALLFLLGSFKQEDKQLFVSGLRRFKIPEPHIAMVERIMESR